MVQWLGHLCNALYVFNEKIDDECTYVLYLGH